MFDLIARLVTRRAWVVVAVALVAAAGAAAFGIGVTSMLTGGNPDFTTKGSDSDRASFRIEDSTGRVADGGVIALIRTGRPVDSARTRAAVERVTKAMEAEPAFAAVLSAERTHDPAMISSDGRSTYVVGQWKSDAKDQFQPTVKRLLAKFAGDRQIKLGGSEVVGYQVVETVHHDLVRAELLAFPILFVLSLWIFRSLVASALPLVIGGLNVVLALLGLRVINEFTGLSVFALNMVTALGLGLAIDYSLLVVSRFRDELAARGDVSAAISTTVQTSGRTIAYSAATVSAAMASLFFFPQRFLWSMAIGGLLVAVCSAAVALLVLPSMLRLLGRKVDFGSPRRWRRSLETSGSTTGAWFGLARGVMRRPLIIALAAGGVLLALGLPFARVVFTGVGAKDLPTTASSRQVDDALGKNFSANPRENIVVVLTTAGSKHDPVRDRINSVLAGNLRTRIADVPGIAGVSAPVPLDHRTWLLLADPKHPSLSSASQKAVKQIRDLPAAGRIMVGGDTARFVDLQASLMHHLPEAVAVVAISSMLVLWLMTGSVLLPLNAVVMNLLTLSATFGVLVLVFQDNFVNRYLHFGAQGALDATQPILLFALVFGLSTDYGVFLMSRMKEARDAGASPRDAVILGVGRTGRIVTAAALLFCVALGAMASSKIVFIKELGFGTALGVLLDATIVRAFLVPSLMGLLGSWSWWSPRLLTALHDRIGLHEGEPQTTPRRMPRPAPRRILEPDTVVTQPAPRQLVVSDAGEPPAPRRRLELVPAAPSAPLPNLDQHG